MNPVLQGYTAAVIEGAGHDALRTIAGDLEAIEELALANGQLQSVLTDTSIRGPVRRAVMLDLLEGKVSEPARRLAAFASSAVAAPDVPSALGWLAHRTNQLADGFGLEEAPLGLLQSRRRVGGFATALHEDHANDDLEQIEDDLFRFARIVESNAALRNALVDRDLAVEARQGLVSQLLEGKVHPATAAVIRYAVLNGRARDIVGTLDWLAEQTALARGWRIARVRAASSVEEAQQGELSASLASLAGAPVELQVVIDPVLLSGAVIQIGDVQVDASARGKIDTLREHLVASGWDDNRVGAGAARAAATTTETEGAG